MKQFNGFVILNVVVFLFQFGNPAVAESDTMQQSITDRIEGMLKQMTLEEKISLLGGDQTGFNGSGVARLGIPPIKMSDGPVGVRTGKATAFPVSVNMAATWDTELIRRYGVALAEETKAKGKTCILGPCVGIHRFPLNGRNFESFGEDPFLSARMAVNYIQGVQSQNVLATVKHFACNDQEWERNNYDVVVDERTLREIHLPAFEYAVREGGVWAVMSAYNIVNGRHCSENKQLLVDILKKDWGFNGIVMSDWVSVYSAVDAANYGLDLEMPHPEWFGNKLLAAVKVSRVTQETIDDKVRRHLRVRLEAGLFENASPKEDESVIRSQAHQDLAREMAEKSIVLLKNDKLLPLKKEAIKTLALIGPCAKEACVGGGGSSRVHPWRTTSPYDGLTQLLKDKVKIEFAEGASIDPQRITAIPSQYLRTPDGSPNGLQAEYYKNKNFEGEPVLRRVDATVDFDYDKDEPEQAVGKYNFSVRWTGKFIAPATRAYSLGISSDDGSRLYIDGRMVADNWGNHATKLEMCSVKMEAGKTYDIKIEYYQGEGNGSMRLGWIADADKDGDAMIANAVALAKSSDAAIVCVGNTADYEGEGRDVDDFKMPGRQDELVQAVTGANPNTVVVVYGGVPVLMENWIGDAKAVIAALYPGQEGGEALARILLGQVNPSGKLPFSYVQKRPQSPAFDGYKDAGLKVNYSEGVFVGYRYYDKNLINPLFAFGHGLSYTTFAYSDLKIKKTDTMKYTVSVDIKNTGTMAGQEVVELYIGQKNSSVPRPIRELKGFAKVEVAPGQTKTVSMELNERAFQFYSPDQKQWVAEPGEFEISVGASSRDLKLRDVIRF